MFILFYITDWIFDIPDIYQDCDLTPAECAANGATLVHAFNKFVDGPNQLFVTCVPGKRSDGLPDWVWSQDDIEFSKFIPKCFDPTYCVSDPPTPTYPTCDYVNPPFGTLRYMDGEIVTYTCQNSSKQQDFSSNHRSSK